MRTTAELAREILEQTPLPATNIMSYLRINVHTVRYRPETQDSETNYRELACMNVQMYGDFAFDAIVRRFLYVVKMSHLTAQEINELQALLLKEKTTADAKLSDYIDTHFTRQFIETCGDIRRQESSTGKLIQRELYWEETDDEVADLLKQRIASGLNYGENTNWRFHY